MDFRIADTFTDSLACLTGDEQKAVKITTTDLMMNPANPGMSFHRLDKARDKNFWSVRASSDLRLIVHRTPHSLLLCYVGHHDDAYHWAESRKIETHPATGAAQIVEIRERVQEITVPKYVEAVQPVSTSTFASTPAPIPAPLFSGIADGDLLAYGVPPEWLADVRAVAGEDALLTLADHLPAEAAEALLELATGGQPAPLPPPVPDGNPFEHPDAQRRFRTLANADELAAALDAPWDQWTIFLHPAQREWVTRNFNGPARVSGSAGTGKTIVALHRAVHLARRHPDSRVLLTTFSAPLATALQVKLRRLAAGTPQLAERIDVCALDALGLRLYMNSFGKVHVATQAETRTVLDEAAAAHAGHGFTPGFLMKEWQDIVDGWQLDTWEAYRNVQRLGRRTRLPESRRRVLWEICADVRRRLRDRGWLTQAEIFARLTDAMPERRHPPYDFAVVDEAQDIDVAQLRFLAALAGNRPDGLFFAGDLGQRIFQLPFSWKSLGVDVRGRSRTLHVNYRTSHQIRMQADRLLDPVVSDVDGNAEERKGTVSAFNGPRPEVHAFAAAAAEQAAVAAWLAARAGEGVAPGEIAVFVRSAAELARATEAARAAGLAAQILDEHLGVKPGKVALGTMHLAKGLEFRAVAVMACDDEVVPSQRRIAAVTDDAELKDVYDTERHLLYVACTRARDQLWVSGVAPVSEFLDDLMGEA